MDASGSDGALIGTGGARGSGVGEMLTPEYDRGRDPCQIEGLSARMGPLLEGAFIRAIAALPADARARLAEEIARAIMGSLIVSQPIRAQPSV